MGYVNLTHPSCFFHFWLPDSFSNPQEPGFFAAGPLLIPFYSEKKSENNTTNKKTSTSSTFTYPSKVPPTRVPPIASTRWFPVISRPLPLVVLVVLQVPVRHHRGVAAIGVVGVVRGHGLGTLGEVRGWFESPGGGHKPWTKPWHPLDNWTKTYGPVMGLIDVEKKYMKTWHVYIHILFQMMQTCLRKVEGQTQKYISALFHLYHLTSSIINHAAQWSFYSRDFNHRSRQVISQRLWDLGSVNLGPSHSEPRSLRVLRSIRRRPGHLFHLLISPHIPRLQSWGFFGLKTPSYISYSTGCDYVYNYVIYTPEIEHSP